MEITENQKKEFIDIISKERLNSYCITSKDDFSILLENYIYNIKISETFYPILSILEIGLRNRINNAIEALIRPTWLLLELKSPSLLLQNEHEILLKAAKKLSFKSKNLTKGALIAELSFGFWVNLCKKPYKTVFWDKKGFFDFVFPYFPPSNEMNRIKFISSDLKNILQLRNRIFHHEIIINHKLGVQNCYNIIEKVLFYISKEYTDLLINSSRFKEIIKQKP